jgi:hypothetical protein
MMINIINVMMIYVMLITIIRVLEAKPLLEGGGRATVSAPSGGLSTLTLTLTAPSRRQDGQLGTGKHDIAGMLHPNPNPNPNPCRCYGVRTTLFRALRMGDDVRPFALRRVDVETGSQELAHATSQVCYTRSAFPLSALPVCPACPAMPVCAD